MRRILTIAFMILSATTCWSQFASNEVTVVAGTQTEFFDWMGGVDLAHRLGSKKYDGQAAYLFVRPQYMYSQFQDLFKAKHVMVPVGLRMMWSNKVLGGMKGRKRVFLDVSFRFRATMSAHLTETMHTVGTDAPAFQYDANPISGKDRFGYYAGFGGGVQLRRMSLSFTWYGSLKKGDVTGRPVVLQDNVRSRFFDEYFDKPIGQLMLCLGYTF
ncbi:MAG: hypothetical protein WDO14_14205 [Bacteroidota bacterium]